MIVRARLSCHPGRANTALGGIHLKITGAILGNDMSQSAHDSITLTVYQFCQDFGYKGSDLEGHFPATSREFT
ncbi:hypothetical protein E4U43_007654 [Claviceps pusilla]|uniref:Uncharacterized protein n=1 Tax=Claviceps pusilla TaxID=123648 RepID=A0A9P7NCG6_9HYPO|nr:hypothetical protein E4U43_007654 [Claviceps pusilla]